MEKTIVSALQFTATATLQNIYRGTLALEIWTSLLPLKSNSLKRKKVTETASTTILFRRLHSFGLDSYLKKTLVKWGAYDCNLKQAQQIETHLQTNTAFIMTRIWATFVISLESFV